MPEDIQIVAPSTPISQAIDTFNQNDLKNKGKAAIAQFNKNEIDQIFEAFFAPRRWKRDVGLGNTLSTFTQWIHVKDNDGYAIWKIAVGDYSHHTQNNIYFDDVQLENRGEATSESATSFSNVLEYDGSEYTDLTTEADSEFGEPFSVLSAKDTKTLYIGSDTPFNGIDFSFETLGLDITLSVQYSKGSDAWETPQGLVDETVNFTRSGRLQFGQPEDFEKNTVNGQEKYWVKLTTTTAPVIFPYAYYIKPLTSVVNLLSLSADQILQRKLAWVSYNGYVYVTIPNIGNTQAEGETYIKSSSSQQNKENYFVSNHQLKADHESYNYTIVSGGFVTSIDYMPELNIPNDLNLKIRRGRSETGNTYHEHSNTSLLLDADTDKTYIFVDENGVLTKNTTGFPIVSYPIAEVKTDATEITELKDRRVFINRKMDPLYVSQIGDETKRIPTIYANEVDAVTYKTGETVALKDNIWVINSDKLTGTPTEDMGFLFKRGDSQDAELYFKESDTRFDLNFPLNVQGLIRHEGNLVPSSNTLTIGTASNRYAAIYLNSMVDYSSDLVFQSGGSTTAILKTDGKLGVGTGSPLQMLDVMGAITLRSDGGMDSIITGQSSPVIYSTTSDFSDGFGTLVLQSRPNEVRPILFVTGTTEKVRITGDGKVGIGDTNPSNTLSVVGSGAFSTSVITPLINPSSLGTALTIQTLGGSSPSGGITIQTGSLSVNGGTTGSIVIKAGASSTSDGGYLSLGGYPNYNKGGSVTLRGGDSWANAGGLTFRGGHAGSGKGGDVLIQGGDGGSGLGGAGSITLNTGSGGSKDPGNILFKINGTEFARLHNNGYFGIGTDSPEDLFTVSSSDSSPILAIERASSSWEAQLRFKTGSTIDWIVFENDSGNDLQIQRASESDSAPRLRFSGDNHNILMALSGGKIGIGTTSPQAFIDLKAGNSISNLMELRNESNTTVFKVTSGGTVNILKNPQESNLSILAMHDSHLSSGNQYFNGLVNNISSGSFHIAGSRDIYMDYGLGGTYDKFVIRRRESWGGSSYTLKTAIYLDYQGYLGINTGTPVEKLHVNDGDIRVDSGRGVRGPGASEQIRFHTTDGVKIDSGGSEQFRIDTSGRVLIGTTSWQRVITLVSNIDGAIHLETTNTGESFWSGLHMKTPGGQAQILTRQEGHIDFANAVGSPQTRMRIKNDGHVGIGTSDPLFPLHVFGVDSSYASTLNLEAANPRLRFNTTTDNVRYYIELDESSQSLRFLDDNKTPRVVFKQSGTTGIGVINPDTNYAMHIGSPGLKVSAQSGSNGLYVYREDTELFNRITFDTTRQYSEWGTRAIVFKQGSSERLRVSESGYLGLGTDSPSERLSVHGNIQLTGPGGGDGTHKITHDGANLKIASDFNLVLSSDYNGDNSSGYKNIIFNTSGDVERVRIDGSGNVGIGTSSPSTGGVGGRVLHLANSGGTASLRVERSDASVEGSLSITSGNISNGLFSTGTKDLIIYTNSLEVSRFTSAGRLGLGISTPGATFDVNGNIFVRQNIRFPNEGDILNNGVSGSGHWQISQDATFNFIGQTWSDRYFKFNGITFRQSGKVGIGTINPASLLHLKANENGIYIQGEASGNSNTIFTIGSSGGAGLISLLDGENSPGTSKVVFQAKQDLHSYINNGGSFGIGVSSPEVRLHVFHATNNSVAKFESGDSGVNIRLVDSDTTNDPILEAVGNRIQFGHVSGGAKVVITDTGLIGVGTTSPSYKLDISAANSGLNISGGNSRIYFGGYRAIEGAQDGSSLQLGESYSHIYLRNSGYVSIGHVNPESELDIQGSTLTGVTATVLKIRTGTGAGKRAGYTISTSNGGPLGGMAAEVITDGVYPNTVGKIDFWVQNLNNSLKAITIDQNTFVGVGTSAPSDKLHVANGAIQVKGVLTGQANSSWGSLEGQDVFSLLATRQQNGTPSALGGFGMVFDGGYESPVLYCYDAPGNKIVFGSLSSTEGTRNLAEDLKPFAVFNADNGRVGFGTVDPQDMLHIVNTVGNSQIRLERGSGAQLVLAAQASNTQIGTLTNHGLQLVTNGNARITIDSSGKVGIGTNSPTSPLTVSMAGNKTLALNILGITAPSTYTWQSLCANGSERWRIVGRENTETVAEETSLEFWDANSARVFTLLQGGGVGIGTTAPQSELHIKSSDSNSGIYLEDSIGSISEIAGGTYGSAGNSKISFRTQESSGSLTTRMVIIDDGKIGIGTTSPSEKLTLENGFFMIQSTGGGSRFRLSTNGGVAQVDSLDSGIPLSFNTQAVERMRITAGGLVGIGTSNPHYKLSVAGGVFNVEKNGDYYGFWVEDKARDDNPKINIGAWHNSRGGISYNASGDYLTFDTEYGSNLYSNTLVLKDGKVGIGVTNPDRALEINKSGGCDLEVASLSSGSASILTNGYSNSTNLATVSGGSKISLQNLDSTNNNYSSISFLDSGGQVTSAIVGVNENHSSNAGVLTFHYRPSGGNLTEGARLTSSGDFVVYNQKKIVLNQGAGGNNFLQSPESDTSRLGIFTANSERISIAYSSGYVGIGKTNPASMLDVRSTGGVFRAGRSNIAALGEVVSWAMMHNWGGTDEIGVLFESVIQDESVSSRKADLSIRTQNQGITEKVRITYDGKVGIGTSVPYEKLDVFGNAKITNGDGTAALKIYAYDVTGGSDTSFGTDMFSVVAFGGRNDAVANDNAQLRAAIGSDSVIGNLKFAVSSTSDLTNISNFHACTRMTITNNGFVGLGITDPSAHLHLYTGEGEGYVDSYADLLIEGTDSRLQLLSTNSGSNGSALILSNVNTSWGFHQRTSSLSNRLDIGFASISGQVDILANMNATITLLPSGNVGINTTNPNQRLHVAGGHILIDNDYELRFLDSSGNNRTALWYTDDNNLEIWNSGGRILFQKEYGLKELASSPSAVSGYGLLYAKSSDGNLYYKTSSGIEKNLFTASSIWTLNSSSAYYNSGNIGIGTTTPSKKLTIHEGDLLFTGNRDNILAINGDNTANKAMLWVGEQQLYGIGMKWNDNGFDFLEFDSLNVFSGSYTYKMGHIEFRSRIFYWENKIGIGVSNPDSKLDVNNTVTNSSSKTGYFITTKQATSSGTYYNRGINVLSKIKINSGVTDSGDYIGIYNISERTESDDQGTLNLIYGHVIHHGHSSGVHSSATTQGSRGLQISPHYAAGTISNIYDLFIKSPETGGTLNNTHYSIYQEYSGAVNYFSGKVGIGTNSPTHHTHIKGSDPKIKIEANGSTELAQLQFTRSDGSWSVGIESGAPRKFIIWNSISSKYVTISDECYVGINTTSPSAMLEVAQSSNTDWSAYIRNGGGNGKGLLVRSGSGSAVPVLQVNDNYDSVRFLVQSDGKIGMGTSSPETLLEILGDSTQLLRLYETGGGNGDNEIGFYAKNGSGSKHEQAKIRVRFEDGAADSEDSSIYFYTYKNGTQVLPLTLYGNTVGIGTSSPDTNYACHIASPGLSVNAQSGSNGLYVYRGTQLYNRITFDSSTQYSEWGSSPISIRQDGSEKLRIDGNVFDFKKPLYVTNSTGNHRVSIGGSGGDYGSVGYGITYSGSSGVHYYRANDKASWLQFWNGGFKFFGAPTGTSGNSITATELLRIESNGKLGIGVAPISKLQVSDTTHLNVIFERTDTEDYMMFGVGSSGRGIRYSEGGIFQITSDTWANRNTTGSTGTTQFYIDSSGKIGIGTTSPSSKLHVNGSIRAGTHPGSSPQAAIELVSGGSGDYNKPMIALRQTVGEADTRIFADYGEHVGWGIYHRNSDNTIHFTNGGDVGFETWSEPAPGGSTDTVGSVFRVNIGNGNTAIGGRLTLGDYHSTPSQLFYVRDDFGGSGPGTLVRFQNDHSASSYGVVLDLFHTNTLDTDYGENSAIIRGGEGGTTKFYVSNRGEGYFAGQVKIGSMRAQREQVITGLNLSSTGWYRVAKIGNSDGRGQSTVTINTTGGDHDPRSVTIRWWHNWSSLGALSIISEYGNGYWSEARVTDDGGTNSYLEVYFTTVLTFFNVSMQYEGGQVNGEVLTSPQSGGGNVRATSKMGRFSIGHGQFFVSNGSYIGIGTDSPDTHVHIYDSSGIGQGALRIHTASGEATLGLASGSSSWSSARRAFVAFEGWSLPDYHLGIGSASFSALTIDTNNNNVGIGVGTSTPTERLVVQGDSGLTIKSPTSGNGQLRILPYAPGHTYHEFRSGSWENFKFIMGQHANYSVEAPNPGEGITFTLWNNTSNTTGTYSQIHLPVFNGTSGLSIKSHSASSGSDQYGSYDAHIFTGQSGSWMYFGAGSGENKHLFLRPEGNFGIGANPGSWKLYVTGNAWSLGSWGGSDYRWKKNIQPFTGALQKVLNLKGVRHEWNSEDYPKFSFLKGKFLGFIAQEVEKVIPEIVIEDDDGYKGVAYDKLTVVLAEAIKEQNKIVEEIRLENGYLKLKNKDLESKVTALEEQLLELTTTTKE